MITMALQSAFQSWIPRALATAFIAVPAYAQWNEPVEFPHDQSCVAWRTQETLFWTFKKVVTGINCNVTTTMQSMGPGLYRFEMLVPISGFQSGSSGRDRAIRQILKESVQPNLFVVTDPRSPASWRQFLKDGSARIHGYLSLAGRSFNLNSVMNVTSSNNGPLIFGRVHTRFEDLGLRAPVVLGGAFTRVAPELELIYQLPTHETTHFHEVAEVDRVTH